MPDPQSSLYGKRKIKKENPTESNASNLSFATQLSSLITREDNTTTRGRARPSKTPKSDLFTKANKGAEKRAASDLRSTDHTEQPHKSSKDIGTVDNATLNRSKRKMAEKVKLYEDMKKGEYLRRDSDDEDYEEDPRDKKSRTEEYHARLRRKEKEGLVDFDRKWAEQERKHADSASESESDDDNASIVSYEDEFGRTRRGTRKEAARAAQEKEDASERGRSTSERWKPARPDNLIYGATVQSEAFNPEETIAAQMARLAAKRDRSATPPESTHYDADAEVRNRGTGFYAFSSDPEERKRQMDELVNARNETEAKRKLRKDREDEWEARVQSRRKELAELRAKRLLAMMEEEFAAKDPEQRTQSETQTEGTGTQAEQ